MAKREDIHSFIEAMKLRGENGEMAQTRIIEPRKGNYGSLNVPLSQPLRQALRLKGIKHLYSHQAAAVNLLRSGKNVVISTSTASGKSLCYNLPALDQAIVDPQSRALYLFPTKALAHDQVEHARDLIESADMEGEVTVNPYDGDTPREFRSKIRRESTVVVTNPDMLHMGILPWWRGWRDFLANLEFVALDEAHIYRGVFGSHVAMVMRRLRRLCERLGASPRFALCSATIDNAAQHSENLTGLPFEVVDEDGSPSAGKAFVFWNPAAGENGEVHRTAADFTAQLTKAGARTLTFARSRNGVERVLSLARTRLSPGKIQSYRAGYLPKYRRDVETSLRDGKLASVVATNAMELGVDIGGMDATITTGYPGSVSSVWQQSGRAGRNGEMSLAMLIARDHPVDQFFMDNPDEFFDSPFEQARVSVKNPKIMRAHLLCAAKEAPLTRSDFALFGESMREVADELRKEGLLFADPATLERRFVNRNGFDPAYSVNIRASSGDHWSVSDESGATLEKSDDDRVFREMHEGAVFLHKGNPFEVTDVDETSKAVTTREAPDRDRYTTPIIETKIEIIKRVSPFKPVGTWGAGALLAEVNAIQTLTGYWILSRKTDARVAHQDFEVPTSREMKTMAACLVFPFGGESSGKTQYPTLLGTLYPLISAVSMLAMCDTLDIDANAYQSHPDVNGGAAVFLWDRIEGGAGIAEFAYEFIHRALDRALSILLRCKCAEGCPKCVDAPNMLFEDAPDKLGAKALLRDMTTRAWTGTA